MNTSYFAKASRIVNPISICNYPPFWYEGKEYKALAPKYQFFKAYKEGSITKEQFIVHYNEQLKLLSPMKVYYDLSGLYATDNVTLLCYEAHDEFCHRHLVSEWLRQAHYKITELNF